MVSMENKEADNDNRESASKKVGDEDIRRKE